MGNNIKKVFVFAGALFVLFCASLFGIRRENNAVKIGSKVETESSILAEIVSLMIQKQTHLKVHHLTGLEGTWVCFNALCAGDIDLYIEYTGTALSAILKEDHNQDSAFIRDEMQKRYDLCWLETLGFENSYALFTKNDAIKTFSHLKDLTFRLGVDAEFSARKECERLISAYGVNFEIMDQGLLFLSDHDVIVAASTDARTKDFTRLEDDDHLFPKYCPSPLVTHSILKRHPELWDVLLSCKNLISLEEMVQMNIEVDLNHKKPYDVALNYLQSKGLL